MLERGEEEIESNDQDRTWLRLAKLENKERLSGFPNPTKYNQYFVNKYSFPKGLNCIKWEK